MDDDKIPKVLGAGMGLGLSLGLFVNYKIPQKRWAPYLLIPVGAAFTGGFLSMFFMFFRDKG